MNFFAIFSGIFSPGRVRTEFGTKIFSLFHVLSHPVLPENNAEKGFFFCFFAIFFQNFLPRAKYERNSGLKFFSLFRPVSSTCWLKIMLERGFLIFLIFFSIFFKIFLPGSSVNGIRDQNSFIPFSAYLIPFRL